jgi:Transmembrane domain of unknown function (DUF3566)
VVTSRMADDNLIDDQNPRTSDIMAPPRQPARQPTPTMSAPPKTAPPDDTVTDGTAAGGVSPNGASAGGKDDALVNGGPAAATKDKTRPDDTAVDGIPALPADTIGPPSSAPAVEDAVIAYPSESAARPAGDDPAGTVSSGTGRSGAASGSGPASRAGSASTVSSAAPAGSRPAPAEPPSVSPAAFAWEMPDPPPQSPSSPARTFLRSGTAAKSPPAPPVGLLAGPGKPTAGERPGKARGAAPKASVAQPKRTARQAHLTVARVEPWSVMKFSFIVSLVAFVILFVAVSVLYGTLAGLGVFDSLQRVVSDVTSSQGSPGVNAKAWFSASRVLGYTALLGSVNIVLITAMSTIGAVVYNLTSRLVGGVEVTLKETE